MNRLILICLLLIFLVSCTTENQIIQSIYVYYVPGISEFPYSNCCDSAPETWLGRYYVDTSIKDSRILQEIYNEITGLKSIDTTYPVNGKINCIVHFANDSIVRLCMGSVIGTIYNGNQYHDNLNLNYLIKKNTGFYYFLPYDIVLMLPEIEADPAKISIIKNEESNFLKSANPGLNEEDEVVEIHEVRRLPYLKKKLK